MPARGYELLPRIICHELRVPFHMPKVGCPALALAAWLRGPHSNCARTETLFSPMARGLHPSPSASTPSAIPRPHPGARAPILHGSTQSRLDRVIPKTSFPGLFKPGILLTGKVIVTKVSHPNLAWLFCMRPWWTWTAAAAATSFQWKDPGLWGPDSPWSESQFATYHLQNLGTLPEISGLNVLICKMGVTILIFTTRNVVRLKWANGHAKALSGDTEAVQQGGSQCPTKDLKDGLGASL